MTRLSRSTRSSESDIFRDQEPIDQRSCEPGKRRGRQNFQTCYRLSAHKAHEFVRTTGIRAPIVRFPRRQSRSRSAFPRSPMVKCGGRSNSLPELTMRDVGCQRKTLLCIARKFALSEFKLHIRSGVPLGPLLTLCSTLR